MGKFYIITIIIIAIILGIVTIFTQSKSPSTDIGLNTASQPTAQITPTPTSLLQAPSSPLQQQQQTNPVPSVIPQTMWVTNATAASIMTNKGEIDIQLYPQDAPKTVTNFATLAHIGYYNGLTFHRVVPGFVIQGGDPNGNGTGGYSIFGPTFEDELNPNTPSYQAGYKAGVVAMANRGPNTNGSQFFIMLADNDQLPHNYTIFGKVTNGMNVVQSIQVGDKMNTITLY